VLYLRDRNMFELLHAAQQLIGAPAGTCPMWRDRLATAIA